VSAITELWGEGEERGIILAHFPHIVANGVGYSKQLLFKKESISRVVFEIFTQNCIY
jgi:hypothetical protein